MLHNSIKTIALILLVILAWQTLATGQPPCSSTYANLIGSTIDSEKGYSVAGWPPENVLYVGGLRNDSVIIIRVRSSGEIEWARTFDFKAGRADHLHGFTVDAEGMIVGLGGTEVPQNGGDPFAFRYDPFTHQMLWAKEYRASFQYLTSGIHQVFDNGDYLMVNNPHTGTLNDVELIRLEKNTGNIVSSISKHIDLGGSESLGDFILHEGFLYAAGRYTDGAPNSKMRTAITKINPQDGTPVWTRLGHISGAATGRLYGVDMVIDQDHLYVISLGNPTGTNLNSSEVYVQKMDLDGQLVWIKRYDLPGTTDWLDEIESTGDGFVILGRNRLPPSDMYLFKIDHEGNRIWSRQFDFSDNDNSVLIGGVQSQMIILNGAVFFTAEAESSGDSDMILVKTDMEGEISDSCFQTTDAIITVHPVSNPVYYSIQPVWRSVSPQVISLPLQSGKVTLLTTESICHRKENVFSEEHVVLCEGEESEGYTSTGTYVDMFTTDSGCDSIRILYLTILPNVETEIFISVCAGGTYEGYSVSGQYVDTLTTTVGCDSIRVLHLGVVNQLYSYPEIAVCPGHSYDGYSMSGTYIDTLVSVLGCDSIRQLTLTVIQPSIYIDLELCAGVSFEEYNIPGMYFDTLAGVAGECDTLRYLTLSFLPPPRTWVSDTICEGQDIDGYTWPDQYTDTLMTADGCDSIRTLVLSVQPTPQTILMVPFCEGGMYGYTMPGTYIDTLFSAVGCDTIRTLHLEGNNWYIPNVFSPNDDQINDVFEVYDLQEQDVGLEYFAIFDRFGNMVYETKVWPIRWDGRHKASGRYCNPGVFAYVLITNCHSNPHEEYGNITLVR